jgi:hypothetical protein
MPYIDSISIDTAVLTQSVEMRRAVPLDPGMKCKPMMSLPPTIHSRFAMDVNYWTQAGASIRSLALLRDNWDGYGGLAISNATVKNAEAILTSISLLASFSAPEVTPTSSGTVSLSWETSTTEAVLEIGNTRYSGYVHTVGQPVIYLQGDASVFSYEDSAMVVWTMQNSQAASAANAITIGERSEWALAA